MSWREPKLFEADTPASQHVELARPSNTQTSQSAGKKKQLARKTGTNRLTYSTEKGPNIGWGDHADAPRWLIRPPGSGNPQEAQAAQDGMGILEWVFDAGPATPYHGWSADRLYEYAYIHLQRALAHSSFRDLARDHIHEGPHAATVVNVEDPLPMLPSAPQPRYYRTPRLLTSSAMEGGRFMFPNYDRPPIAPQAVNTTRPKVVSTNLRTAEAASTPFEYFEHAGHSSEDDVNHIGYPNNLDGEPMEDSSLPSTRSGSYGEDSEKRGSQDPEEDDPSYDEQGSSSDEEMESAFSVVSESADEPSSPEPPRGKRSAQSAAPIAKKDDQEGCE